MPKISIIIPVYNTEQYLKRCLESVCSQTLKDIEIICVNDSSSDNSLALLKEFEKRDNRIKIINLDKNEGASVARNSGLEIARGEYLGFVDSDDTVDLDFYEKLYSKAKSKNADVVKGTLKCFYHKNGSIQILPEHDLNNEIKKNKAYFYYTFTTAIYKTNFIKTNKIFFPKGIIHFEDPFFTIKAGLYYKKIEIVEDACYYYIDNPSSTSRKIPTKTHVHSLVTSANMIVDMLNKNNVEKLHYIIVFNFVMTQVLIWCGRTDVEDILTKKAINGLIEIFKKCKYKNDFLNLYFLEKKKLKYKNQLPKIREIIKKDLSNV